MKILVTGCAGYVGSLVVQELLSRGYSVRGYDSLLHGGKALLGPWSHPHFEFVKGDVRDANDVKAAAEGCGGVVHLAAIVGDPACARDPEYTRAVNLDGSRNVIEAAKAAGAERLVFASTCSNYGKMSDPDSYVDENSELSPVSLYAETKVDIENMVLDSALMGDICGTSLRFATVYGVSPRMRFDLTVNQFTMEMLRDKKLLVFGEQFWRPYIHVRDMARGVATVYDSEESKVRGEVFNVGSTEENYTKQMLVDLMSEEISDAVIDYVKKDEDPRDYRVSFEKIRSQLGFEISVTVPEGIREVAQLVRSELLGSIDTEDYKN